MYTKVYEKERQLSDVIICELFTIVVYNTPKYSTVYTTVSQELIESTIIITSSTTMSYTTKSTEVSTSIPHATNSTGVPSEGEVVGL